MQTARSAWCTRVNSAHTDMRNQHLFEHEYTVAATDLSL